MPYAIPRRRPFAISRTPKVAIGMAVVTAGAVLAVLLLAAVREPVPTRPAPRFLVAATPDGTAGKPVAVADGSGVVLYSADGCSRVTVKVEEVPPDAEIPVVLPPATAPASAPAPDDGSRRDSLLHASTRP